MYNTLKKTQEPNPTEQQKPKNNKKPPLQTNIAPQQQTKKLRKINPWIDVKYLFSARF